jgi:hypothetical protein
MLKADVARLAPNHELWHALLNGLKAYVARLVRTTLNFSYRNLDQM